MSRLNTEIKGKYRNRVLQVRLQKEIKTQKDLAGRTGIRQSILCDIESNKLFLSSIYALRIVEVLGCSIDDLYEKRI
ncbi:MAG: helix-turn-helix transcriptional regulator [candidate division Zixibacteria bacterium]|nr:helix-turn-helix transcriptional regulator [candidate division Zixibacteria bacterium]